MRNLENEKTIGLESYFGGKLRPHTKVVHHKYDWDILAIPDGKPIPPGYNTVRFYAPGEVLIPKFKRADGIYVEGYHSHDHDVTSWSGNIAIKYRQVE